MQLNRKISEFDLDIYNQIRRNVSEFQTISLQKIKKSDALILDVAPQVHEGVKQLAPSGFLVETIDINNEFFPTICGDICMPNSLPKDRYDAIFCTEVLEHVANPFDAVNNLF